MLELVRALGVARKKRVDTKPALPIPAIHRLPTNQYPTMGLISVNLGGLTDTNTDCLKLKAWRAAEENR